jgi:hypothetical protein
VQKSVEGRTRVISDKLAEAKHATATTPRADPAPPSVFNGEQIPMAVKALANDSPVLVDRVRDGAVP